MRLGEVGVTSNIRQSVRRLVEFSLTSNVQAHFNRDGLGKKDAEGNRKKKAFGKTEFYSCILGMYIYRPSLRACLLAGVVVRVCWCKRVLV